MSDRIPSVVLGAGTIGRIHAIALARHPAFEPVAIASGGSARAASVAEEVSALDEPEPKVVSGLHELGDLADHLVVIATPTSMHPSLAEAAWAAKAHVLVEKPLDTTLSGALRLARSAAQAEESGLFAAAVSQHRFDPSSSTVRAAIEEGRLGRLTSAVASVAWWRSQAYYDQADWRGTWSIDGGGALMNQAVHTLDLLVWLVGEPVEVSARFARLAHTGIEVEDVLVATITFASGALATMHATTAAYPGLTARIQIMGERGSAIIDDERLRYLHVADAEDGPVGDFGLNGAGNQHVAQPGDDQPLPDATADPSGHLRQYDDLAGAIQGGRRPVVTVADALATLAVTHACYRSATTGAPVRIQDFLDEPDLDRTPEVST